ncbi:hypothetical protein EMA8858_01839 [Emticicia aquatica]|jgi:DNA-binding LytR/AlgR family response regulator|uniref:HTH LytTR-type domain-containing protein n=1 Tax=Emticicia aquatica TaxID=1681835 RepID=A0ABM9AQ20_9BACT|nr:LytTR family DNA-binding domain-containing protein [Emticicia aquatica]CAH0995714.1 hypothetical protein EMA8858_01839 [Emticicia aquatica]
MEIINIKQSKKNQSILPEEILKIEACINYSIIFLKTGHQLIVAKTLKKYEKDLKNCFFRVNRSTLVNINSICKSSGDQVELHNGQCLTISRRRLHNFNSIVNPNFRKLNQ